MDVPAYARNCLACPACGSSLSHTEERYACVSCKHAYPVRNGKVIFFESPAHETGHTDDLIFSIKNFLKVRAPGLFFFLYNISAAFVGVRASSVAAAMPEGAVMLNIGSGAKRIPRVISVDVAADQDVDIVGSAYQLPYADASVDLIISESLLEHLERPMQAVAEMRRVLKRGGKVYILTPFMLGFHSSPNDFYRWTIPGMTMLLEGFHIEQSGVAIGPTSALTAITREWLALALSFNSTILYQFWTLFFMALFIPLNWLDFILTRFRMASQIALAYYWVGIKS